MTDHQREELKRNIETIRQKNQEIAALRLQIKDLKANMDANPQGAAEALADFLVLQVLEVNRNEAAHEERKKREALRKLLPPSPPRFQLDPAQPTDTPPIMIQDRFVVMEVIDDHTIIHFAQTWHEFYKLKQKIAERGNRFITNL